MAITTHMCRGNFRSSWVAEGGYDFVAEALFNELAVDGFFMEWDDARSGGFEPLRFVPKGKVVVLGLVTTKKGDLETKDLLKRRIEEASQVRRPRPALPVAPVRLLLDRRGQRVDRRAGDRQAAARRRDRRRGLGLAVFTRRPPLLAGVVAAALGVALTTLLVFALRDVAPVRLAGRRLPGRRCWWSPRSGASGSGSRPRSPARSRSTSSTSRRPAASRSPAARTGSRWSSSSSRRR